MNSFTKKLRFFMTFSLLSLSTFLLAQEATAPVEEAKPTFSLAGSIDAYFHSSLGTTNGGGYAPSTSFANGRGFSLGMANLIASYGKDKVGFTADLVFGPRGKEAVFGTATGQAIVNQMFTYYKLSDKVTLNLGQFNTFVGYEVISPTLNFHYSTSYLFSWGPFNHTGLRADFDLGSGFVGKLAIMNPTDIVEFNTVNTYTLGAQIGKTGDAGGVWLNFLYGDQDGTLEESDGPFELDENGNTVVDPITGLPIFVTSKGSLFQGDVTLSYNLGSSFSLGFNASLQSVATGEEFTAPTTIADTEGDPSPFLGFAIYPKLTLSKSFALGLRAEYFSVNNNHLQIFGLDANGDGSVTEFTLSGNYKSGALTIIPEFRIDLTSEDSFLDSDDKATAMLPTFNLAVVYKF